MEALKRDLNLRIHIVATLFSLSLGFLLKIAPLEWIAITCAIGLVIISELINTAIESICNKFHPERDSEIGKIKDISAAAVLVASIIAASIGAMIFLPKLF